MLFMVLFSVLLVFSLKDNQSVFLLTEGYTVYNLGFKKKKKLALEDGFVILSE